MVGPGAYRATFSSRDAAERVAANLNRRAVKPFYVRPVLARRGGQLRTMYEVLNVNPPLLTRILHWIRISW